MRPDDYQYIAAFLKERSGLVTNADKTHLVETRLRPVALRHGHRTVGQLIAAIRAGAPEGLNREVVEAMTTRDTHFFRDPHVFDQLRDGVLPYLLSTRIEDQTIRIWCAACSSGQEAYSIAIMLAEVAHKLAGWRVQIIGSDLSIAMIDKAKRGIYSQFEVQKGLPIRMLIKYFDQLGDHWELKAPLRTMVSFRHFNLLHDPAPLGRFDLVLCRNVLVYFDQPTRRAVYDGIARLMPPDGFLVLGSTETVLGVTDKFKVIGGLRGTYGLSSGPLGTASLGGTAAG